MAPASICNDPKPIRKSGSNVIEDMWVVLKSMNEYQCRSKSVAPIQVLQPHIVDIYETLPVQSGVRPSWCGRWLTHRPCDQYAYSQGDT